KTLIFLNHHKYYNWLLSVLGGGRVGNLRHKLLCAVSHLHTRMKSTSRLSLFLLGLGLAAALPAQEVKVNIPGQPAAPAPASPPPATAPAAPQYTEDQMIETMGWFLGKRSGLADLQLSKEQTDLFIRGL